MLVGIYKGIMVSGFQVVPKRILSIHSRGSNLKTHKIVLPPTRRPNPAVGQSGRSGAADVAALLLQKLQDGGHCQRGAADALGHVHDACAAINLAS